MFGCVQVHKIAVLDLRLCNADRNGSNILAARVDGEWKLTPIDHGFCLPDSWTDMAFVWSSWRQVRGWCRAVSGQNGCTGQCTLRCQDMGCVEAVA